MVVEKKGKQTVTSDEKDIQAKKLTNVLFKAQEFTDTGKPHFFNDRQNLDPEQDDDWKVDENDKNWKNILTEIPLPDVERPQKEADADLCRDYGLLLPYCDECIKVVQSWPKYLNEKKEHKLFICLYGHWYCLDGFSLVERVDLAIFSDTCYWSCFEKKSDLKSSFLSHYSGEDLRNILEMVRRYKIDTASGDLKRQLCNQRYLDWHALTPYFKMFSNWRELLFSSENIVNIRSIRDGDVLFDCGPKNAKKKSTS